MVLDENWLRASRVTDNEIYKFYFNPTDLIALFYVTKEDLQ